MTCRWVFDLRLTTFGRCLVITSSVLGLTTATGSAVALAASDTVGHSPSAKVVSFAPMAVSVTFLEPLRAGGARLRILTDDGDVGIARVTTGQKTLKRELRLGAPPGRYTIVWSAVSVSGRKMSGKFWFTAVRGNGVVEQASAVPSPTVHPTWGPAETPELASGSTSIWTSQSTPTATTDGSSTGNPLAGEASTGAPLAGQAGHSGTDRSVSTGLTAVPLIVGGLLVLAAGLVSLINRQRLHG